MKIIAFKIVKSINNKLIHELQINELKEMEYDSS